MRSELTLKFAATVGLVDATCTTLPAKAEKEKAIAIEAANNPLIPKLFTIAMIPKF
ncbi:hypothetical protein [Dyella sp. S184]|uniref:hypothetical protein n=1 Tax=Dyella sp. S184 TaxID=1641862 RepID=UPI0020B1526E|nr:hypothetical protein [Dyella sp. S184]